MSANMRSDAWHLHSVNIIVPADHVVESVLPVHCHQRIAIIIAEKDLIYPSITISSLGLCGFDDAPHTASFLKLMIDIYYSVHKFNILKY